MKRLLGCTGMIILLCLSVSCNHFLKQREVRAGLDASVGQLPELANFEMISISSGQSSMETCHYAEATVMLGTVLTEEEALEAYIDALQSLGWVSDTRQYERERGLTRGTQESIVIRSFPSWMEKTDEEYLQARDTFPTIIFVDLWFYVPQRDGC